jgi:hypothetical protein
VGFIARQLVAKQRGKILQNVQCLIAAQEDERVLSNSNRRCRVMKQRKETNANGKCKKIMVPATACLAASSKSLARNNFKPLSDETMLSPRHGVREIMNRKKKEVENCIFCGK